MSWRSSRTLLALPAMVLVIVAVLVVLHQRETTAHERYVLDSNLRALSVLGRQIEQVVGGLNDAVTRALEVEACSQAIKKNTATDVYGLDRSGIKEACVGFLPYPLIFEDGVCRPGRRGGAGIVMMPPRPEPVETSAFGEEVGGRPLRGLRRRGARICVPSLWGVIPLTEVLEPLVAGSTFDDDDVLVMADDGSVVFERGRSGIIIQGFAAGDGAQPAADKPVTGEHGQDRSAAERDLLVARLPRFDEVSRATTVSRVVLGGKDYLLLTQPIALPAGRETREGAGTALAARDHSPERWVVAALVPTHRARGVLGEGTLGLARALTVLVLFAVLVLPWLKLATMSGRDRLSARDLHLLGGCTLLITVLGSLVAMSWYGAGIMRERLDAQMHWLAAGMRSRFRDEMRTICRELYAIRDRLPSLPNDKVQFISNAVREPAIGDLVRDYPFFESVVVVDGTGWQVAKWATGFATPKIKLDRQLSFRDPTANRLPDWGGSGASDRPGDTSEHLRCALTVQVSPNTTNTIVVASVPRLPGSDGSSQGTLAMVPRLMSLVEPVIPPGLAFAVVQDDGQVLFHSVGRRRLFENLFDEVDRKREIEATVLGRHAGFLDFSYHGRSQRAWLEPLADTSWTLVVLHDREELSGIVLDASMTTLLALLAYAVVYVLAVLTLRLTFPGERGDWIWANRSTPGAYLGTLAALALLAGWGIRYIGRWAGEGSHPVVLALALPPFALALVYVALTPRRDDRGWWWGLCLGVVLLGSAAAAVAAGGIGAFVVVVAAILCVVVGDVLGRRPLPHGERLTEIGYVGSLFLGLVIAAVLPTWAIFSDAFAFETEAWLHARQVGFAEAFAHRAARLNSEFMRAEPWVREAREGAPWDRPAGKWAGEDPKACAIVGGDASEGPHGDAIVWVLKRVGGSFDLGGVDGAESARALCSVVVRHPTSLIPLVATPALSDEIARVRGMSFFEASDGKWELPRDHGLLIFRDPRFFRTAEPLRRCSEARGFKMPSPPRFYLPGMTAGGIVGWGMVGLVVTGMLLLLRYLARCVFGLGFDEPDAQVPGGPPAPWRGRYVLRPTRAEEDALTAAGAHPIDLRRLTTPGGWHRMLPDDPAAHVVVLHLGHRVDEPEWNRAKLALLERLVFEHHGTVDVTTDVDLLPYFTRRLQSPGDPASEETYCSTAELVRWAWVLEPLRRVRTDLATGSASNAGWRALVEHECRWTERLLAIRDHLLPNARLCETLSEHELLRYIADLADAHYRLLWSGCTDGERLVMIHLAKYGFVSPPTWGVVRRLVRRGLIRTEQGVDAPGDVPANGGGGFRPALMNRSCEHFVLGAESEERIVGWEHAAGASSWHRLRLYLLMFGLAAGGFLFVTQPDTLSQSVGFLGSLAAGLGALMQILGLYRGAQAQARTG